MKFFKSNYTKLLVLVLFTTFIISSCNKDEDLTTTNTIINDSDNSLKKELSEMYPFSSEYTIASENSATRVKVTVFSGEEPSLRFTNESFSITSSLQNINDEESIDDTSAQESDNVEEEEKENTIYHVEIIELEENHNAVNFNFSDFSSNTNKMADRGARSLTFDNGNSPSSGDVMGFSAIGPNCNHTHYDFYKKGGWGLWNKTCAKQSTTYLPSHGPSTKTCNGSFYKKRKIKINPDWSCDWSMSPLNNNATNAVTLIVI